MNLEYYRFYKSEGMSSRLVEPLHVPESCRGWRSRGRHNLYIIHRERQTHRLLSTVQRQGTKVCSYNSRALERSGMGVLHVGVM